MHVEGKAIPFWVFRPGAVIEFEVFSGQPLRGVIKHLTMNGPRSHVAVLSEFTDEHGVLHEGIQPHINMLKAINISHAKRVIAHAKAGTELRFESDSDYERQAEKVWAEAMRDGSIMRRGRRLVIDGKVHYAPNRLRSLVRSYIEKNQKTLGVQPWEMLDFEALYDALFKQGVAKQVEPEPNRSFPSRIDVNTVKLKHFLKRNINRFKCDTRAEERFQDELDAQLYEEDMNRELSSGYPY